ARLNDPIRLKFDPMDVPRDRFLIAGDAWAKCRRGGWDANRFGSFSGRGLWVIAADVIRDLAALNRMEMLPSDQWGWMAPDNAGWSEKKRVLLDHVAALTLAGDRSLEDVQFVYEAEPDLHVRAMVVHEPIPQLRYA